MSAALTFSAADRVLVLAPHPDDESIATGGLLQAVRDAGAQLRVVVLTDGDNNPWPQRWIEKHWRIDADDRARWGARRRNEARAAMATVGMAEDQATFFGMPDLGLTDLLMHARIRPVAMLRAEFEAFAPTTLIMPALSDRHPDHSAVHILARLALVSNAGPKPKLLGFAVHGGGSGQIDITVALSEAQRDGKRAAILAHTSQMRLSQRRFLKYVRTEETYWSMATESVPYPDHPARATVHHDTLDVQIDGRRWGRRLTGHDLFIVLESDTGVQCRWQVPLGSRKQTIPVFDAIVGAPAIAADQTRSGRRLGLRIALPSGFAVRNGWVKIAPPQPGLWVLDRYGWQVVAVS